MELLDKLAELFEDVASLKQQSRKQERKVNELLKLLPNEIRGHRAAGEVVGVCEHQMLKLAKGGAVPHKTHGRRVSYLLKDLIEYKESRQIESEAA